VVKNEDGGMKHARGGKGRHTGDRSLLTKKKELEGEEKLFVCTGRKREKRTVVLGKERENKETHRGKDNHSRRRR